MIFLVIGVYQRNRPSDSLKDENLQIPDQLDAYPVAAIGDEAFSRISSLTSVTIHESISDMGVNPFLGCERLEIIRVSPKSQHFATIDGVLYNKTERKLICYPKAFDTESYSIPNEILSIGDRAFYWCTPLKSINIPQSVTEIGDSVFNSCKSLISITLPQSVTAIESSAFRSCVSLTGITLPEGIKTIEDCAFGWCKSITNIKIPKSVTVIGNEAFKECGNILFEVEADSYAEKWADGYGYDYTYVESLDWLFG